jgi:hypothetical protein
MCILTWEAVFCYKDKGIKPKRQKDERYFYIRRPFKKPVMKDMAG